MGVTKWLWVGFVALFLGGGILAYISAKEQGVVLFYVALVVTSLGIYAIRTIYFAALKNGKVPIHVTGTAVGIISLVGYTPDIFVGPMIGYLLDASPGGQGFLHVFMLLLGFALLGGYATYRFGKIAKENLV
jgi:hypothetical protein